MQPNFACAVLNAACLDTGNTDMAHDAEGRTQSTLVFFVNSAALELRLQNAL